MRDDLVRVTIDEQKHLYMSVPIPPSVNHIYYNTRGGGKRLTRLAEKYMHTVRAHARECVESQSWIIPTKGNWVYMDLAFFFPDKRIRDSHNCLKILLDALEGVVFENDYYIVPRIRLVELDRDDPRTVIHFVHQTEEERQSCLHEFAKMVY